MRVHNGALWRIVCPLRLNIQFDVLSTHCWSLELDGQAAQHAALAKEGLQGPPFSALRIATSQLRRKPWITAVVGLIRRLPGMKDSTMYLHVAMKES